MNEQLLKTSGAVVLSSRKKLRKTLLGGGGGGGPRPPPPPPLVRPRVKLEKSTNFKALFPAVPMDLFSTGLKTKLTKKNFEGSNL